MSRIGKQPVLVPAGVDVTIAGQDVTVKKGKTSLSWRAPEPIAVTAEGDRIVVSRPNDLKKNRALHGLTRALIQNMVTGVSEGFKRDMLIYGVGYSCDQQGTDFILNIGFCHSVKLPIPEGITATITTKAARGNDEPARFSIAGPDKQVVGQFCADIRRVRPPEPYKGKGIRYADEYVARKEGKSFVSGS